MDDLQHLLRRASVKLYSPPPNFAQFQKDMGELVSDYLGIAGDLRGDVFEAVLSVVHWHKVGTVVLEHHYVDVDYLETYGRHYSKAFKSKPADCLRLHFFKRCEEELTEERLFSLTDGDRKNYLGYCIIRPTGHQYVSRTVIRPPHEEKDDTKFIHAWQDFDLHFLGQPLCARGAPFIQQDANTFICAEASIWTVALFMHQHYHTPRFYPSEIGELARRSFSHAQLREGLTVEQIVMTLRIMGFNPHVLQYNWRSDKSRKVQDSQLHKRFLARVTDFIHLCVDSHIPPILAYTTQEGKGHAVAVVGHNIQQLPKVPVYFLEEFKGTLRNSCFLDSFFVMDDARGPYVRFSINPSGDGSVPCLADCLSIAVIAPMPIEATVEYLDLQGEGMQIGELDRFRPRWNNKIQERSESAQYMLENSPENPIVYRAALRDSRQWKRRVISSGMPNWLKRRYQAILLPKYVWMIEISDWTHINHRNRTDRQICGEVILDATANPHWPLDSLMSFHGKGYFWDNSTHEPDYYSSVEPFEWYPPLRRSI